MKAKSASPFIFICSILILLAVYVPNVFSEVDDRSIDGILELMAEDQKQRLLDGAELNEIIMSDGSTLLEHLLQEVRSSGVEAAAMCQTGTAYAEAPQCSVICTGTVIAQASSHSGQSPCTAVLTSGDSCQAYGYNWQRPGRCCVCALP